jgi:hypothetical protein
LKLDKFVTRTAGPSRINKRKQPASFDRTQYELHNAEHELLDSLGVPDDILPSGANSIEGRRRWARHNLPFGSYQRKRQALEEFYQYDWNNSFFNPPDTPGLIPTHPAQERDSVPVGLEFSANFPPPPEKPQLPEISRLERFTFNPLGDEYSTDARQALQGDPDATAYLSRPDRAGLTDPDRTIHRDFSENSGTTMQIDDTDQYMGEAEKGADGQSSTNLLFAPYDMPYYRRRYYRRSYGRRPYYKRRTYRPSYRRSSYRRRSYGGYKRIFRSNVLDDATKKAYFAALPASTQAAIKAQNMLKAAYGNMALKRVESMQNAGYGAYGNFWPFSTPEGGYTVASDRPGTWQYRVRKFIKKGFRSLPKPTRDAIMDWDDDFMTKHPLIGNREWQLKDDYGSRLGSVVGEGLQGIGRIFGFGAYNSLPTPKKNTLMDLGAGVPTIRNARSGECVAISHREYVGDLIAGTGSPTAFTLQEWDLNPANGLLFPWLSELVNGCFEEWEPAGIIVSVKSMCSDYSTNSALGSMFACVIYNPDEPAPTTKAEVENAEYAVSVKPSESMLMPIECAPVNNTLSHYYLPINGSTPPGRDAKFYNMGKLYIGSQGTPTAGAPLAEIWVTYQFNFFKPKLGFGGGIARDVEMDQWVVPNATGVAAATPFGGSGTPIRLTTGSSEITDIEPSTNTITWVKGAEPLATYLVRLHWLGTSAAIGAIPTITVANGAEFVNNLLPAPNTYGCHNWNTTSSSCFWEFYIRNSDAINPREMSISMSNPASLPTSLTGFRIMIIRVNGDVRGSYSP